MKSLKQHGTPSSLILLLIILLSGFVFAACEDSSNNPANGFNGSWEATYQIETGLIQSSTWSLYESAGTISGTVRLQRGQWYTESDVEGFLESNNALSMNFVGSDSLNATTISSVVTSTRDFMTGVILFVETDPISGKSTVTSWGFEAVKK